MSEANRFVHLRVHSAYSIVDGLASVEDLVSSAAQLGMPAMAITDHCNLFSMVKFYKAALAAGIKPIIGSDVWLENLEQPDQPDALTLLCQSHEGYHHLSELMTQAYQVGQETGKPVIARDWLTPTITRGLIALSGGVKGGVGKALLNGQDDQLERLLAGYHRLFPGRYYLEVARIGRPNEEVYIEAVCRLAEKHRLPVVATNEVCFLKATDFEAHEARVCIYRGNRLADPSRSRDYTEAQYLRDPQTMQTMFSDIPEALSNAVEIAKRCTLVLELSKPCLPNFPVPASMTVETYFKNVSAEGLAKRLAQMVDFDQDQAGEKSLESERTVRYEKRLSMELNTIISMGFAGYFLIVSDFVRWAKSQGIRVGPGRGSGAGSLVAYALGITDVDPLKYDLLFERLLNPERVSMPDFDIDFCMEGRDRVIQYVTEQYGRENVAQIITYGRMAAKAVVRDVGRVLGHPYGFVDRLAKLIPFELGITLRKALQQEEALSKRFHEEEAVNSLIKLATQLEGTPRNVGTHAGGVVIAPSKLTHFSPLYCEPGSRTVITQLDKDDIEAIGLVKFDFLGLRTLTIIDWALEAINKQRARVQQLPIDIDKLPLEDSKTYELLKSACTTAVFQLESRPMRELVRKLQPDCFADVIPLVALMRPGPLQSGMVDNFINRRQGRSEVSYLHPKLEPILRTTYGVILYQEQVMRIAEVLAGYTPGSADILRKAMGKKKPEEMLKQRAVFLEGAINRGVSQSKAAHIFDLMEKFAGYGFNKSHSVAYALLTYRTAWLKAHYPAQFMAAVLSSDMDNTDKLVVLISECQRMGIEIIPPCVHRSQYRFTVSEENALIYGLGAIKGIGEPAAESIIAARQNGPFKHLGDFCQHLDIKRVNRRSLEALICVGALDSLGDGLHRAMLMASLDEALGLAEQYQRERCSGQMDLLGGVSNQSFVYQQVSPWPDPTKLQHEKHLLGWYCSGHPIMAYRSELERLGIPAIEALERLGSTSDQKTVWASGIVVSIRVKISRSGAKVAFVKLDDASRRLDVMVYGDLYQNNEGLLVEDRLICVKGQLRTDRFEGEVAMRAEEVWSLVSMRARFAKRLILCMGEDSVRADLGRLKDVLTGYLDQQACPIVLLYQEQSGKQYAIAFGVSWRVRLAEALIERLRDLLGKGSVRIEYKNLMI